MFEIERKFLVDMEKVLDFIHENECKKINITQVYVQKEPDEIRIRKSAFEDGEVLFVKTIKRGHGLVREEHEMETTAEEFDLAMESGFPFISKKRFIVEGLEFDFYKNNLVTMEKEFESEEEAISFNFDYDFIIKEITGDKEYSNYTLAMKNKD